MCKKCTTIDILAIIGYYFVMLNIEKWKFVGIIIILYVSRAECDIFGELLMSVKTLHDKVDNIGLEQEKIYQMQEANNGRFNLLRNDLKTLHLEKESKGEVLRTTTQSSFYFILYRMSG